jgi:predicted double-glycine peptidase
MLLAASGAAAGGGNFRDWVTLRDAGVVRQRHDFSCGLASLATLLTHYYQMEVGEDDLLAELENRPGAGVSVYRERGVSLADLAWLSRRHGIESVGLRLPPAALSTLRRPVIVYLEQRGEPHFSVLRGTGADGAVLLADPAAGNRRASAAQFAHWFAIDGERGRALLLAPADERAPRADFFGYRRRDALLVPPGLLR